MDLKQLRERLRVLTVFRGLLSDPVVEGLCAYLNCRENNKTLAPSMYAEFVSRLYHAEGGDLAQHILRCVEEDENVYVRAVGCGQTPPDYMARCVEEELRTLQAVSELTPGALLAGLDAPYLPAFATTPADLDFLRRIL